MSTFTERKMKGNLAEAAFIKDHPRALRCSPFHGQDFTTKTDNLPPGLKYEVDFMLVRDERVLYVEVKYSLFWNENEYHFQRNKYGDRLYLYYRHNLYSMQDINLKGPFKGTKNGSGMDYYRVVIK